MFEDLPLEIIHHILFFSDPYTIGNIAGVSKFLFAILEVLILNISPHTFFVFLQNFVLTNTNRMKKFGNTSITTFLDLPKTF